MPLVSLAFIVINCPLILACIKCKKRIHPDTRDVFIRTAMTLNIRTAKTELIRTLFEKNAILYWVKERGIF